MAQRDVTPFLSPGDEWVGALVTLPSYVTGEEPPYRPVALMWVDAASQLVVDTSLFRPEEALANAAEQFIRATRKPTHGRPHTPARVRVSDPALAAALRGSIGPVELVVAPIPEIDEIAAELRAHFSQQGGDAEDLTFIGPDTSADDVAAMFAAAARLHRASPWKVVPPDAAIGVRCELLGISEGALLVVGQMGTSYGFSLFSSLESTMAFFEAIAAREEGEVPEVPGHLMFSYDTRAELPAQLVREVAARNWELASTDAYPSPTVIDDDRIGRGLTRVELVGVTAIMTALAELVEAEPDLAEAWEEPDEELTWNRAIETPLGIVEIELRVPLVLPTGEHKLDTAAENLLEAMARVPGVEERDLEFADMLSVHVGEQLGVPLVQVSEVELRALLFDYLPAHVAIEPDVAADMFRALRTAMKVGAEVFDSATSRECLAMLEAPDLPRRLEHALADTKRYSPAKAMVMQGIREGYDLTTDRGVAAWVAEMQRRAEPRSRTKPKRPATAKASTVGKTSGAKRSAAKPAATKKSTKKKSAKRPKRA